MIYLYGAGGHAKVILELLELQGEAIGGLIDLDPEIKSLLDYPVYTTNETEIISPATSSYVISVGDNLTRKKISEQLNANYFSVFHPAANISVRATIAEGTVVMAGVSINSDVTIGKHTIINTNSSIDHDCSIGNYVHISPNVALAGNIVVGEGAQIGIGACVIPGITIGRWATIGAGAVIINNVPDYAVVVGNPGKIIKYNQINE